MQVVNNDEFLSETCVCIHMYVYIYIYIYVCVCVYVCIYECVFLGENKYLNLYNVYINYQPPQNNNPFATDHVIRRDMK